MHLHSVLQVGLGTSVCHALGYRRRLLPVLHAHWQLCACIRAVPSPSRKASWEQSILTLNQHQANVITRLLVGCSGRDHFGSEGIIPWTVTLYKGCSKGTCIMKKPITIPNCFIYSAILLPCLTECQFAPKNLTIILLFPQKSAVSPGPLGKLHIENQ